MDQTPPPIIDAGAPETPSPVPRDPGFTPDNNPSAFVPIGEKPKKKSHALVIILILLLVGALGFGGYELYENMNKGDLLAGKDAKVKDLSSQISDLQDKLETCSSKPSEEKQCEECKKCDECEDSAEYDLLNLAPVIKDLKSQYPDYGEVKFFRYHRASLSMNAEFLALETTNTGTFGKFYYFRLPGTTEWKFLTGTDGGLTCSYVTEKFADIIEGSNLVCENEITTIFQL